MQVLIHSDAGLVAAGRSPGLDIDPVPRPIGPMPPFHPVFPVAP